MSATRVLILGAGPGGYVAALRAAHLGATVTLVERGAVGGVCLNHGCIPTKALLASVSALRTSREAEKYGVHVGESRADWGEMLAMKERVVGNLRKGVEHLLKKNGIRLVEGSARFLSECETEVTTQCGTKQLVNADRVIIATGSSPVPLQVPIRGFEGGAGAASRSEGGGAPRFLTSDKCLELRSIPSSMLVIGGGAIGLEFSYIFACLGTHVTIVEMMPRILPAEDHDVSEEMARELRRLKVNVLVNCRLEEVESTDSGLLHARLSSSETVTVSTVLTAVGRRPNSAELNLQAAGIQVGASGWVTVNERMETSAAGVFAIGDVTGGILLAHKASAEGIVAAENAVGGDSRMNYDSIPRCIFTDPQTAAVGLTEEEAKTKGLRYKVGKVPLRALGKAHAVQKTAGFVKVIAEGHSNRLLGAHMVGHGVSEMIHEVALAIRLGLDASAISSTVHAHPTLSEAICEAALAVEWRALYL
jgi:dihydrolipoamide dehydrogenase